VPPRASADGPALDLLMTILGGGESSRLNRVLVRQEQAALASGGLGQFRVGPGSVLVFGIANQGVSSARLDSLMAAEIERLRSDTIAEAELAKARSQYRAGAVRTRQTTMGVAETLQGALRYLGDLEAANTEVARYLAVTTADLRRVAAQYLAPANRTTVIVNPPSAGGN